VSAIELIGALQRHIAYTVSGVQYNRPCGCGAGALARWVWIQGTGQIKVAGVKNRKSKTAGGGARSTRAFGIL